jgi:hypothetical protein
LSPKFTLPSPSDTGSDKIMENNIDIDNTAGVNTSQGATLRTANSTVNLRNSMEHAPQPSSPKKGATTPRGNDGEPSTETESNDKGLSTNDDEENGETEEKLEPELEAKKEELGEVLDDLLYEAYSHFLQGNSEPFVFKMPEPLSAAFADDQELFKEILSKIHIEEDPNSGPSYYKLGKRSGSVSTNKMQHEFAEFKDMVLVEFTLHWQEKRKGGTQKT